MLSMVLPPLLIEWDTCRQLWDYLLPYKLPWVFASVLTAQVKKMEASMKFVCFVGILVVIGITGFSGVDGAGECGKANPDMEAFKLAPCAAAANDDSTTPTGRCCAQVKKMGQNPKCLCAVMLSNTAKSSGIKLASAITIPKRCNISDRPIGYQCGAYTLP